MKLEELAAQAQQTQDAQDAREVLQAQDNSLEAVAARMDAEKLSLLRADLRQAIEDGSTPAAMLTMITGALFGTDSAEAAAVAEAIDKARAPGGHELQTAILREQRRQLNLQQKKLTEQQQTITEALEKLTEAERALIHPADDTALADVLTFCKSLEAQDEAQQTMLQDAAELYEKHGRNPAAMGLLYGTLTAQGGYTAGRFDLIEQRELGELLTRIEAAMTGR